MALRVGQLSGRLKSGTALVLLAAALSACAGKSTRPETGASQRCLGSLVPAAGFSDLGIAGFVPTAEQQFYNDLREKIKERLRRRNGRTLNILVLSGGGQHGAYGAGVLHQWATHKGANPVAFDDIDLVTGISTGALQSIFVAAALGAKDPTRRTHALSDLYNSYSVSDRDIFNRQRHLVKAALFSNSLNDAGPLATKTKERLTDWRPEIVESAKRGVLTLIGMVQLEDGGFYVGQLDKLVGISDHTGADCATTAIMASAAVPLAFPPRYIGERTFVDGGVRHTSFMGRIARDVVIDVAKDGAIDGVNVLVLRNGTMSANGRSSCDRAPNGIGEMTDPTRCLTRTGQRQVENGLQSIIERSVNGVMTNQIERDSLYRMAADLEEISRRVSADQATGNRSTGGVPPRRNADLGREGSGFTTGLWLSHMRNRDLEEANCSRPAGASFDKTYMSCIRLLGERRASAPEREIGDRRYAGAFLAIPDGWFALDETISTENLEWRPLNGVENVSSPTIALKE